MFSFGLICEYPIPWYKKPLNVYYTLVGTYIFLTNQHVNETHRLIKAETGKEALMMLEVINGNPPGIPMLLSTLPELDFPLAPMPDIVTCGPILRPTSSVEKDDPELFQWLSAGPTVMVNLGTHCQTGESAAIEMAKAFRMLFDTAEQTSKLSGLRVLWKLKQPPHAPYSVGAKSPVYDILAKEILDDRVRIEEWISVEPGSILETGHVVCSINHGGANSWSEGVWSVHSFCALGTMEFSSRESEYVPC